MAIDKNALLQLFSKIGYVPSVQDWQSLISLIPDGTDGEIAQAAANLLLADPSFAQGLQTPKADDLMSPNSQTVPTTQAVYNRLLELINDYNGKIATVSEQASTAIVGVAATDTVPVDTTNLFAKYSVAAAGTYTNFLDASSAPIVVQTAAEATDGIADLDKGIVELWGKNGVWSKNITPIALAAYQQKSSLAADVASAGFAESGGSLKNLAQLDINKAENSDLKALANIEYKIANTIPLPRDKSAETDPSTGTSWLDNANYYGSYTMIITPTSPLKDIKVRYKSPGSIDIAFVTIGSGTATLIYSKKVTAIAAGTITYLPTDLSIPDLSSYAKIYVVFRADTNSDKCIYAEPSTNIEPDGFSFPVSSGVVSALTGYRQPFWVDIISYSEAPIATALNSKAAQSDLKQINSLSFPDYINEFLLPYDKTVVNFSAGILMDIVNYYSTNSTVFNGSDAFKFLHLNFQNIGSADIAFVTIVGGVATVIYNLTVNTADIGWKAFSPADLSLPDLSGYDKIYVFCKNDGSLTKGLKVVAGAEPGGIYFPATGTATVSSITSYILPLYIEIQRNGNPPIYLLTKGAANADELLNTIAAQNEIIVGEGIFVITSTIQVRSGMTFRGIPGRTIIKPAPGLDLLFNLDGITDVSFKGIKLQGNAANTNMTTSGIIMPSPGIIDSDSDALNKVNIGTSKGMHFNACERVLVEHCEISNFDSHGIENLLSGKNFEYGVKILNNYIHDNYLGIETDDEAEYSNYSTNSITRNQIGVYCNSGNVKWSQNQLDKNRVGFVLNNGTNSAHGSITGGSINHCSLFAIVANGVANGQLINGVNIWYGTNRFINCQGLNIVGCLSGNTNWEFDGGKVNMIANGMFIGGGIVQNLNGNTSNVKMKNNFYADGTDSTSINN
ncbi:right-handed parallel beta-helix repeat-containing protein [Arachidicoccus soli]|uniref:Uncharacterized protein n=1 Tax=Arachidicoccus soli TaxID=2341117 RepID=A0A386HRT8_9BACT|nr:hypothetical protein [Arachidicoccus soli]AYD48190.1 hypothetical protein D6B99_11640 [Arachidicoccus soli]